MAWKLHPASHLALIQRVWWSERRLQVHCEISPASVRGAGLILFFERFLNVLSERGKEIKTSSNSTPTFCTALPPVRAPPLVFLQTLCPQTRSPITPCCYTWCSNEEDNNNTILKNRMKSCCDVKTTPLNSKTMAHYFSPEINWLYYSAEKKYALVIYMKPNSPDSPSVSLWVDSAGGGSHGQCDLKNMNCVLCTHTHKTWSLQCK